ncbi:hypothetical protein [Bdellovibrio sp. HCB337]|uniref:hypothetical protein n=1 Tax=Bdellovibrio sp. HCB337 TaxID=3394358 RepID=UPI0039A72A74
MSSKILLVYEEYSEMMNAQAILQKAGFDVLGISTEYTLSENVLSFNPDVVVAYGRAGKVTTIGAGRRLREMTRWQGKVILVLPAGYKPNPQDFAKIRADMLLEAPLPGLRLMQIVGKMLGYDELLLQERLSKHGNDTSKPGDNLLGGTGHTGEAQDEALLVTGQVGEDPENFTISGTPIAEDEEDFTKAKAKFNLDISSETAGKPAKKDDQDLEALWKELTDHSELSITPEDEAAAKAAGQKINFDLSDERSLEISTQEVDKLAKEIQNAKKSGADRVSKYGKYTAQINDFDPRQSLSKIASRRSQKEIVKSWNNKEIEDQDELRKSFTKALFRKK